MSQPYHRYALFLLGLVIFDTIFTFIGYKCGILEEANPILQTILLRSDIGFIVVRLVVTAMATLLVFLEKYDSRLVQIMCIYCILVYFSAYGISIWKG